MIVKLRIDDRLLHGQVAYSWKSALSYDAIVIASNAAAGDSIRRSAMKMCCPDGVKMAVRTLEEAAVLLQNEKLQNMKVFVVTACPKDADALLGMIPEKPVVNLGGMQMEDGKQLLSPAVYVNKEDIAYLDVMLEKGYVIEVQEVPSTAKKDYSALKNKVTFK
ncbi:MAG: PTS sugar transporter subunit IIB [Angelakisella sp.]